MQSFDLITCLPSFVTRFNADGIRTELLRLAFDERVLDELRSEERERTLREAVFVGSLGRISTAAATHARPGPRAGANRVWGPASGLATRVPTQARLSRRGVGNRDVQAARRIAGSRSTGTASVAGLREQHALYEATGMGPSCSRTTESNLASCSRQGRKNRVPNEPGARRSSSCTTSSTRTSARRSLPPDRHEHSETTLYGRRMRELAALLEDVAGDPPGARGAVGGQARADHGRPRLHRLEPRARARRGRPRGHAGRLADPGVRRQSRSTSPGSRTRAREHLRRARRAQPALPGAGPGLPVQPGGPDEPPRLDARPVHRSRDQLPQPALDPRGVPARATRTSRSSSRARGRSTAARSTCRSTRATRSTRSTSTASTRRPASGTTCSTATSTASR